MAFKSPSGQLGVDPRPRIRLLESRDAVDGIHLSALDIACPLFDARLMDGVWIVDLPWL
jgi:hypothetical protein